MFEDLVDFSKIIVTGPQRSGTSICAQMIAHDFKLRYVDENDMGLYNEQAIEALCDGEVGFVLQCPRAAYRCHVFSRQDVAIVFMYRSSYDIKQSQDRINWTNSYQAAELGLFGLSRGSISTVKYNAWRTWQRDLILNPFEIWYDTLHEHEFWVKPEDRHPTHGRETYVRGINSWVG